ncbi:MAG: HepT-like ribonuclease domain-containing protein [Nocardioides sp.]
MPDASERILEFVDDRSGDDYQRDVLLRSAVERQFQIVGEALN